MSSAEEILERATRALVRHQSQGICDENYPEECSMCDCFHDRVKEATGHGFNGERIQAAVVLDAAFPDWREETT